LSTNGGAGAAIGNVGFEVDAEVAAFRRLPDAIEGAFASRADFARSTCRSANATIGRVDRNVDTFTGAFRGSTDAREAARSIGTNLAVHAFGATHAAVVGVECGNGTRAITFGLTGGTCRSSSLTSRTAHSGGSAAGGARAGACTGHTAGSGHTAAAGASRTTFAAISAGRIVRRRFVATPCNNNRAHGDR
jgi:hypothetical protein